MALTAFAPRADAMPLDPTGPFAPNPVDPGRLSLHPGARPLPDYELVDLLGRGGFGEVWKARGPGGLDVALKFIRLSDPYQAFEQRSWELMRTIRHPNLLALLGSWQCAGYLIVGMELADRSLLDRLQQRTRDGLPGIPASELLAYMRQAAQGIDHLNGRHVLHRDVKPQNLLLVGGGVKVADFGLAKLLEGAAASHSGGMTAEYAAPEFFQGKLSAGSDQYSLAATYCELRGGRTPFRGNAAEVMAGHLMRPPDLTMVPEAERPVLARALAKRPEERWPSCEAFVEALAGCLSARGAAATAVAPPGPTTAPRLSAFPTLPPAAITVRAPGPGTVPRARRAIRRPWLGPAVAGAAGLVALFLFVAVLLYMLPRRNAPDQAVSTPPPNPDRKDEPIGDGGNKDKDKPAGDVAKKDADKTVEDGKTDHAAAPNDPNAPPGKERVQAGSYFVPQSGPGVLLTRPSDKDPWKRLAVGGEVDTSDALVSLPGCSGEVWLAGGGARVLLRGHVREFSAHPLMDFLMDSAVTLHKPAPTLDADLTLHRGRVYFSNHKGDGPARFRLRFGESKEVWDLTLQGPDAEVGVDLLQGYTADTLWRDGESPFQELLLFVLNGDAALSADYRDYPNLHGPVGPAYFHWSNKGPGVEGPFPVKEDQLKPLSAAWSKEPLAADQKTPEVRERIAGMREALDRLNLRLTDKTEVEAALGELLRNDAPASRLLAVYCLGAIDDAGKVLDVLADDDPTHAPDREAAVFTLRRWLARDQQNGPRLYDPKADSGLLRERGYRSTEAETVIELLHDFNDAEARQPATYEKLVGYLKSDRVALRELAWWQLIHLGALRISPPPYNAYNAGLPVEQRDKIAGWWQRQVDDKKLPPPLPTAPGPGGP
jgi:serine/threonine protein kinase